MPRASSPLPICRILLPVVSPARWPALRLSLTLALSLTWALPAHAAPSGPQGTKDAKAAKGQKGHGEAFPRQITPGEKVVVALIELGQKKMAAGDLPGALQAFDQAHTTAPKDARPVTLRGVVHQQMKKLPEAIADYRAALLLDPAQIEARVELGALLTEGGHPDEALPVLTEATRLAAGSFEAHYNLALAHEKLDHWPEAAEAYRKAAALNKDDADVRVNLAVALRKIGKNDEALQVAREAARLAPDDAQAHLNLGLLLSEAKRFDEAVAEMTAATRLQPRFFKAWWRLGVVQLKRDQAQAALLALEQARAIKTTPDVLTDIGLAKRKLGDIAAAESSFRSALGMDARYVPARIHLAATLAQTKRCKDAQKELLLVPARPEYAESVNRVRAQCQYNQQVKGK